MERYQQGQEQKDHERDNPHLQAALAYARQGLPVFPVQYPVEDGSCSCGRPDCSSAAKHPRTKNGVKDATLEETRIHTWWQRTPSANIGLATGMTTGTSEPLRRQGLIVLDVDPRHGGNESLLTLMQSYGRLPYTRLVLTGGGGRHYYFATEEELKCTVDLLGLSGLDIRAQGGYVIAPPSRHISGNLYRFAREEVPVAKLPEWLAKPLRPRQEPHLSPLLPQPCQREGARPSAEECLALALAKAKPGNRNVTGFLLACTLRDQGVKAWEAEQILRDFAAKVPQDGEAYTAHEALASAQQAYKRRKY